MPPAAIVGEVQVTRHVCRDLSRRPIIEIISDSTISKITSSGNLYVLRRDGLVEPERQYVDTIRKKVKKINGLLDVNENKVGKSIFWPMIEGSRKSLEGTGRQQEVSTTAKLVVDTLFRKRDEV